MATDRIEVVCADIVTLRVDAIVNAANERMLGGGGVDGAIHRAAGPGLLAACREVPEVQPGIRCPTGEARITPGFQLPARFVVHTVGPIFGEHDGLDNELLARCYRNSIQLAFDSGARSITFPAISCGAYGFPPNAAARIVVRTLLDWLSNYPSFGSVLLISVEDHIASILAKAIEEAE